MIRTRPDDSLPKAGKTAELAAPSEIPREALGQFRQGLPVTESALPANTPPAVVEQKQGDGHNPMEGQPIDYTQDGRWVDRAWQGEFGLDWWRIKQECMASRDNINRRQEVRQLAELLRQAVLDVAQLRQESLRLLETLEENRRMEQQLKELRARRP